MLGRAIENIVRFRYLLCGLVILACIAISPFTFKAAIPNNSVSIWFLESDPLMKNYRNFHKVFGNDEIIAVLLEEGKEDLFTKENIEKLRRLEAKIAQVDGVFRVNSIGTVQDTFETEDGIVFKKLSEQVPHHKLKEHLLSSPYFKGRMISEAGSQILMWIQMDANDSFDSIRDRVVEDIYEVLKAYSTNPPAIGGTGVIYAGLNKYTSNDLIRIGSIGYLLMFIFLGLSFRSTKYVLAALTIVGISSALTVGILGLVGGQINMFTVVLPTIIMVLGVADAIHFPTTFAHVREQNPDYSRTQVAIESIRIVFWPCMLTSLTTAIGFLSLASAEMTAIRELGIYSGIGVMIAFFCSIIVMAIFYIGFKGDHKVDSHRGSKVLTPILNGLKSAVLQHNRLIAGIFLSVFLLFVFLLTRLDADTFTLGYLPDDSQVVVDHNKMEESWGYYTPFEFTLEYKNRDYIETAETLEKIEEFTSRVEKLDLINTSFSIVDIYRRIASVMGKKEDFPWTNSIVDQLKFVLEGQNGSWDIDDPEYLNNFSAPTINEDRDLLRITFTSKQVSGVESRILRDKIMERANEVFGSNYQVKPTGFFPLYTEISRYAIESQIRSFTIAIIGIFLLMLIWLRSLRLALISLIPNLFPVLGVLATMWLLDLEIDISTATITAIVIGIAIDDTIHFLYRWRQGEMMGMSWENTLDFTFTHAGKAAMITSFILMFSYPVLMLADVKTIQHFGLLTSTAAFLALIADLLLLPSILKFFHKPKITGD